MIRFLLQHLDISAGLTQQYIRINSNPDACSVIQAGQKQSSIRNKANVNRTIIALHKKQLEASVT